MIKWGIYTFVLLLPVFALAHQPAVVDFTNYDDNEVVEDVTLSQAYYGDLINFPHTYEINLTKPETLFVELLVPDIEGIDTNRSVLIVKRNPSGRVREVARLVPEEAEWESFYEPFGGDSYLRGPSFKQELEAGSYLIEVSTGDNLGKYVLVVGEREDFSNLGYFETVKRIYEVKKFYGKSPLAVLQSPIISVPLLVLLIVGFFLRRWYKKKHA